MVVFRKVCGATVYVIGEDRENILSLQHPHRVVLPMAQYSGGPEAIQEAVQIRLKALLDAVAHGLHEGDTPLPFPSTSPDQVLPYLKERLGRKPLKAILIGKTDLSRLELPPDLSVYLWEGSGGIVYGISEPKYVGHIVIDTSERPPSDSVYVGLMAHGGVVGVRV